jgi:hypothetical protein
MRARGTCRKLLPWAGYQAGYPAVSLLTETSYYLRSSAGRRRVRAKSGYAAELARLHPRMVAKEAGEMHLEADHGLLDAGRPRWERSQYGRSLRASLAGKPTADGLVEVERAAGDLVAGAADDDGLAVPRASARPRRRLPMVLTWVLSGPSRGAWTIYEISGWKSDNLSARAASLGVFLRERSWRIFRPLGRKDVEIEHRFIAEHLTPMGDVRGDDD